MRPSAQPLSGWHDEDVKAAIRKRGASMASLARQNGFSDSYLRNVFLRPLYRGEQIIARFIGVPAERIWPARYAKTRRVQTKTRRRA